MVFVLKTLFVFRMSKKDCCETANNRSLTRVKSTLAFLHPDPCPGNSGANFSELSDANEEHIKSKWIEPNHNPNPNPNPV